MSQPALSLTTETSSLRKKKKKNCRRRHSCRAVNVRRVYLMCWKTGTLDARCFGRYDCLRWFVSGKSFGCPQNSKSGWEYRVCRCSSSSCSQRKRNSNDVERESHFKIRRYVADKQISIAGWVNLNRVAVHLMIASYMTLPAPLIVVCRLCRYASNFGFGHIHTIRKNPKIAPICQIRVATRGTCTCEEPQPIPIDYFSNPNNQLGYDVRPPNRSVSCQRECKRIRLEFRLYDCGGREIEFCDLMMCSSEDGGSFVQRVGKNGTC